MKRLIPSFLIIMFEVKLFYPESSRDFQEIFIFQCLKIQPLNGSKLDMEMRDMVLIPTAHILLLGFYRCLHCKKKITQLPAVDMQVAFVHKVKLHVSCRQLIEFVLQCKLHTCIRPEMMVFSPMHNAILLVLLAWTTGV